MSKKHPITNKIVNRRARYDYELGDNIIAGVILSGRETKALRQGRGQLQGAFITIKNNEPFLTNSLISNGKTFAINESEQTRSRKLLLSKKQIHSLIEAKNQGKTIVPLEFLTKGKYIKLKIAIGKGKKRYDKRETIKKRDQERNIRAII
jgi:SsrA-binding protein